MANATLSAMIDNKALLKTPGLNAEAQGVWKDGGNGKYLFALADKQRKLELEGSIESTKLVLGTESYTWVFEK
jgi:hypothetical protein